MTNSSPWKIAIFKNGKNHLFLWAIEIPWRTVSHNQVGYIPLNPIKPPFSYGFPKGNCPMASPVSPSLPFGTKAPGLHHPDIH